MPKNFIPVVEKFQLIDFFSTAVIMKAVPLFKEFKSFTQKDIALTLNISPLQLYNSKFTESLKNFLHTQGITSKEVVLEITENFSIVDDRQLLTINRLAIQGFQLAADNYGTGLSNVVQLKKYPFHEVKIDAQLVQGIARDQALKVIVSAIRSVGDELNMRVVAEGVESADDLNALNDLGVEHVQGNLICRAKPLAELLRWYSNWNRVLKEKRSKM